MLQKALEDLFAGRNKPKERDLRAVIIVPTRELAVQTFQVLDDIIQALAKDRRSVLTKTIQKFQRLSQVQAQAKRAGMQRQMVSGGLGLVTLVSNGVKRHPQRLSLKVSVMCCVILCNFVLLMATNYSSLIFVTLLNELLLTNTHRVASSPSPHQAGSWIYWSRIMQTLTS